MRFAYELSARQSARLIEQARRIGIVFELQPRTVDDSQTCEGRVTQIERDCFVLELTSPPGCDITGMLGAYCDSQFTLNEHRYMFETSIVDASNEPPPGVLHLAPVESLMVAERRKFWRASVAESSGVLLTPPTEGARPISSILLNLSPDGVACAVSGSDIDALLIGEPVRISFTLPAAGRVCELTGVICNKTPSGTEKKYIVGIQFVVRSDSLADQAAVDTIRTAIYENQVASGKEESNR